VGISTPARSAQKATLALQRPAERTTKERAFRWATLLSTVTGIVVLVILIVSILLDGIPFLTGTVLTEYASRFADETGYRAGITGTLSLMVLVALFSFPVGVGAAIYLEEFAPVNRFTRLMEANISNLAGVPSIVYGLLGAAVFVYLIGFGRSLLTGALTLSLLILPVIIVAGREAIRAVPQAIREGGLALGATPWQVVSRQVLPVAMPGILTGTILSLSRAIGETAPILVAGAVFSRRADNEPWHTLESFTALPIQIYQYVGFPNREFRVGAASAGIIILMVLLLLMNSVAIVLRNRFLRRLP
jgi:phosphate transport system permease protein